VKPKLAALATLLVLQTVAAPSAAHAADDPAFMQHFFAPELVLKHASAIQLTKQQRAALTKDIGQVTGATTELQLSMMDGLGSVEELSAADPVDENALLGAIHEVLMAEMRVKEAHMGLLVRIRNLLTPEQRERLRKIRAGES
jgi:Spy/CpxP family protein refolding chaperone